MVLPRIEERTLYTPIVNHLESNGFQAIGNTMVQGKEPDIIFKYGSMTFVIEVKVGKKESVGLSAVAQAYDYGRRLKTQNVIILIYPEEIRNSPIDNFDAIYRIAIENEIWGIILTESWTESRAITVDFLARQLKLTVDKQLSRVDFASAVKLITNYATDLNSVVYQIRTDELIAEVVNKLDLFASIGEIKEKEAAKNQVISLASFLLFNQLLFYHVYTKKAKDNELPEMEEVKSLKDIQEYFNLITAIDYKSIYRTNLLAHIPETRSVLDVINEVIKAVKLLRAEYISHDLAGRFFHDLIPFEVRKILAAFYTHPNSADLLTGLAIDNYNSTVIDPACGSGTLLVSSYKAKMKLYADANGSINLKKLHKEFLENEVTGIDIMPFAAHITTLNLAMQNIEEPTNIVRIASMDSLTLSKQLKKKEFGSGNGIKISGFEHSIQTQLTGDNIVIRKRGAVSAEGRGKGFTITPSDLVIMNPPFSDREKMPADMREKINENDLLNRVSGNRVNLWGSFMALSDMLLKNEGKVAAVIPINIARGEATKKIRQYMLKNYSLQYIVKPLEDEAFSEGASFKDVLFIARKRRPLPGDYTAIVTIKTSIKNLPPEAVRGLISRIRSSYERKESLNTGSVEIGFMETRKISVYENNLMPIIGFSSTSNKKVLDDFLSVVRDRAGKKLTKIDRSIISEGFHASPSGLSELVFITKPMDPSRVERAFLIVEKDCEKYILVKIKGLNEPFPVDKLKLKPALRTLTAVKTMDASNIDYVLIDPPDNFEIILNLSKWKGSFDWSKHRENVRKKTSNVVVGRRFRPNSKNTHHFAFYAEKGILSPHTFKLLSFKDTTESKIQTLILNSALTISNILSFREQTTGGFTDIMESELVLFDIFDLSKLSLESKNALLILFEELSKVEFPSILDQYVRTDENLMKLDLGILSALGFGESEAKQMLFPLYEAIIGELKVKG